MKFAAQGSVFVFDDEIAESNFIYQAVGLDLDEYIISEKIINVKRIWIPAFVVMTD